MLRLRPTFKGSLTAALAALAFLLGAALGHPYLNLSGYVLMGVLLVGGGMGYVALRGIRVKAVASRRSPESDATDVWVSLDSRSSSGPFGLDVDGYPGLEIAVRSPDRVGKAFHLPEAPGRVNVHLRSLPLGLVEITRQVPVAWLDPGEALTAIAPDASQSPRLAEPDGRLREHRPGEGMRQVHWPLSARLQRLIVRVREREEDVLPRPQSRLAEEIPKPPEVRLDLVRAFTLLATLGAIAFLWQQSALQAPAVAVLMPLVVVGGMLSLRRAGPPSKPLLLALYVAILAIMAWFVMDLRGNVLSRGPIALTVMSIAALFAWDLRDRSYIRAQLFMVVFATVLLPAFFPAQDGQGTGFAFGVVMLALILAAWAEGRHAIGAARVRFSELGTLSSAIVPFGFFAAMVLILHPWLPAIPLPSLPTFGLSQVRVASRETAPLVPGQQGRVDLDARWPQGDRPAVEVLGRSDRLRSEVFDTYRQGAWSTSGAEAIAWPASHGNGDWIRITLRTDAMRVLPLPSGAWAVRDALLEPVRQADGSVRLSRPAWIGYTFEALSGVAPVIPERQPTPAERDTEGIPRELNALAHRLAGDAASKVEALERIAHHLRSEMRYDLQAPKAPEGVDPVVHFMTESRRGFCVHFASALALLGRELGIPTRLVGGYSGGRRVGDRTVFDERHAHAWVEAYVDGRWITLDPTPGGTFMPAVSSDQGRIVLALGLLLGIGVMLWRRRREPEAVRHYRRALERLQKRGAPVTEATTPREALAMARAWLDDQEWHVLRDTVECYERERFGVRTPRAG